MSGPTRPRIQTSASSTPKHTTSISPPLSPTSHANLLANQNITTHSHVLLVPTCRSSVPPQPSINAHKKHSASRLSRSSRTHIDPSPLHLSGGAAGPDSGDGSLVIPQPSWVLEHFPEFEIIEDSVEMEEYQLYAVEKWVVQRNKPLTSIVVYTGEQAQKVYFTALRPHPTLTIERAQAIFDTTIKYLRADGARPRETTKGVIMVTSLPNFRPDLAIVHIPGGDLRAVQEKLYVNINLVRMGCTGRSALTLDEPFQSTKEKFMQMYHFPDTIIQQTSQSPTTSSRITRHQHAHSLSHALSRPNQQAHHHHRHQNQNSRHIPHQPSVSTSTSTSLTDKQSSVTTGSKSLFRTTVINLAKYTQAALSLFGWFPLGEEEQDGLLCDRTLDGLQNFIVQIGNLFVDELEVSEDFIEERKSQVVDPTVVAALFSFVASTRNKLHVIGVSQPRDPFMEPAGFLQALTAFQRSHKSHSPTSLHSSSNPGSTTLSLISPSKKNLSAGHLPINSTLTSPLAAAPFSRFLDAPLIERINEMYVQKTRPPEPYKVHRVLMNKLDEMATSTSSIVGGGLRGVNLPGINSGGDSENGNGGGGGMLGGGGAGSQSTSLTPGIGTLEHGTIDLELLSKMVVSTSGGGGSASGGGASGNAILGGGGSGSKLLGAVDSSNGAIIESLKFLWLGKVNPAMREREKRAKEREKAASEARERLAFLREGGADPSGGSFAERVGEGEDEGPDSLGDKWRGTGRKVKRNIEAGLLGLGRVKKTRDVQSDPELSANATTTSTFNRLQPPDALVPPLIRVSDGSTKLWPTSTPDSAPSSSLPSPILPSAGTPLSSIILTPPQRSATLPPGSTSAISSRQRPVSLPTWAGAIATSWSDPFMDSLSGQLGQDSTQDLFFDALSGEDPQAGAGGLLGEYYLSDGWEGGLDKVDKLLLPIKRPKRGGKGGTERRHSFSTPSEFSGIVRILPPEQMKADVDLCGVYFELQRKHEDMRRISTFMQALVGSVKQTNESLSEKLNDLTVTYALINTQAERLAIQTRQGRVDVEDIAKKAASLDYRMGELERGTGRLKVTLEGYRLRNHEMRNMARQAAGDDDSPGSLSDDSTLGAKDDLSIGRKAGRRRRTIVEE